MAASRRTPVPVRDEDLGVDYTRYSTEEQGSTSEQRAINQEIAADEGVRIVATFSDEGVSRSLSDRPDLKKLFAYLEAHPAVGFLIVNELERITAGVDQRQQITSLCKRLRITIITEDMGRIDPHDEDKMHEADQRAVAAKGEVLKVRRRTRRNLRAKIRQTAQGKSTTVALRPPFGMRMAPLLGADGEELPSGVRLVDGSGRTLRSGKLELHPDEYPWLQRIFEWAAEGVTYGEIASRLTTAGVPTKNRRTSKHGVWRSNTVVGILDNPLYKGEMTWGRQQVLRDEFGNTYLEERPLDDPGRISFTSPLGAVISPALWDKVQVRRQKGVNTRRMVKRVWPKQIFDGRMYCGRCGNRMYGRCDNPKAYRENDNWTFAWRYACPGKRSLPADGYEQCTSVNTILDGNVLKAIAGERIRKRGARHIPVTVTIAAPTDVLDSELSRKRLAKEIEGILAEKDRIGDGFDAGFYTVEEAKARKDACQLRIVEAQAKLDDMRDDVGTSVRVRPFKGQIQDQLEGLVAMLQDETFPVELKQEALDRFGVERVYFDNPSVRLYLSK